MGEISLNYYGVDYGVEKLMIVVAGQMLLDRCWTTYVEDAG